MPSAVVKKKTRSQVQKRVRKTVENEQQQGTTETTVAEKTMGITQIQNRHLLQPRKSYALTILFMHFKQMLCL